MAEPTLLSAVSCEDQNENTERTLRNEPVSDR